MKTARIHNAQTTADNTHRQPGRDEFHLVPLFAFKEHHRWKTPDPSAKGKRQRLITDEVEPSFAKAMAGRLVPTNCSALRVPHSALRRAFTRAELLIILAVLALLALVVLPALANTRPRSARVICANNLRQIGMGFQLWGNDHDDKLLFYVYPVDGGTRLHPLAPNPWLHFSWISNELATPKVLLCPSDSGNPAQDFSGSPAGGYLHANFANRATSYLLSNQGGLRFDPDQYLSGDRNVSGSLSGGSSIFGSCLRTTTPHNWLEGLHYPAGNLLRNDGRVEYATDEELRGKYSPALRFLFEYIVPR